MPIYRCPSGAEQGSSKNGGPRSWRDSRPVRFSPSHWQGYRACVWCGVINHSLPSKPTFTCELYSTPNDISCFRMVLQRDKACPMFISISYLENGPILMGKTMLFTQQSRSKNHLYLENWNSIVAKPKHSSSIMKGEPLEQWTRWRKKLPGWRHYSPLLKFNDTPLWIPASGLWTLASIAQWSISHHIFFSIVTCSRQGAAGLYTCVFWYGYNVESPDNKIQSNGYIMFVNGSSLRFFSSSKLFELV